MAHHWHKRAVFFAKHSSLFGPVVQLIMIKLSLTALHLCFLAQDVLRMAHTLTIVEPIWPMLQILSKTLLQADFEVIVNVTKCFWLRIYT